MNLMRFLLTCSTDSIKHGHGYCGISNWFWPQHFEASVLLLLVFLLDPKGCLISYTLAGLASYIRSRHQYADTNMQQPVSLNSSNQVDEL